MRTIRLFLVLGVMLAAFSCDKDDDVLLSSFEVAKEIITPSYTTVHIVCEFSTRATVKNVFVHYSKNADFSNYEELKMVEKNGKFSASLSALQRNTTYYIRYAAKNSYSSAVTKKVSQAKTLYTVATVTTTAATDVSYTTATVGGEVTSDGGASVTERGVCYSTAQNPTTSSNKISSGSGTGSFSVSLTGLSDDTTYYARAYAINSKGTSYGEQVSFTTNTILPVVITTAATNISYTSVTVGGNVTSDGYARVTERGVCYSTAQNPTTSSNKISSGSGTGSFSVSLTGLSDGTTYYVRAYAINSKGTSYGEQVSFTTNTITLPIVITTAATRVSYTTATIKGEVTSDGGASVTECGVCYSTAQNPTTSSNKISSERGTDSFSVSLTGLSEGITYYVRAYAINSKGTSYGEQVSFTTPPYAVDLGLSVKWATCNVGATAPHEYGNYYAWGETETKTTYSWATYKWCNGSRYTLTKYNTSSDYGTVDNKTQLELADDAARVNWGGAWRMPTKAEWTELLENCTWTWKNYYNGTGISGLIGTSKINGNSIFLPAAGCRFKDDLYDAGNFGYYWSSSLDADGPWNVFFDSRGYGRYGNARNDGQSVRPVLVE